MPGLKMITVRVPAEMVAATRRAARRDGYSMNRWCQVQLAAAVYAQSRERLEPLPALNPIDFPGPEETFPLQCFCSICRRPTPRILFMRVKWRCFECDEEMFAR